MEGSRFTLLGLPGSLRRDSFNVRVLRRAASIAPAGVDFDLYEDLGQLPHFSQDYEGDLTPSPVLAMRERIEAADAVLVATPEYNSSVPGSLKNALDWASRPPGESRLKGKPAAVAGASPGRFGAVRAQEHVRMVLGAIGAQVLDRELAVPRAHEAFAEDGALRDAEIERDLAALVAELVALAGREVPARFLDSFDYSVECQRLARAA